MSSFRISLIICGLAAAALGSACLFHVARMPGLYPDLISSWLTAMGLGMAGWGAWPRDQSWTRWAIVRLCCVLLPLVMLSFYLPALALDLMDKSTWDPIAEWALLAGLGLSASNLVLGFAALVMIALRDHRGAPPGVHGWWAAVHFVVLPFALEATVLAGAWIYR